MLLAQNKPMTIVRLGMVLLVMGVSVSSPAFAQTTGKFALGAQVSKRASTGPEAHGHLGLGLLWRVGHGKTGFGWDFGLNWYSADVDRSIGGTVTELGELNIRPIMGGYGYTYVTGRTSISAKAFAGYGFTSATLAPSGSDAYRDRLGARSITIDASNAFVAKPEIGVWRDLSEKIGLRASVGYMVARPQIAVRSSAGEDKRRMNADMIMIKVGMVYSIY
jgi:hypothetical protein